MAINVRRWKKRAQYKEGSKHDLILLVDISEDAIAEALCERLSMRDIYTYIGDVLVSVNPFVEIEGLYSEEMSQLYQNRFIHELPPHIFAIGEAAYRDLTVNGNNHCVIIAGESGAGKTEASKRVLQYLSTVSGEENKFQHVKEQFYASNPVLEAFGNAKTIRNDNSSRFGKYFEVMFSLGGNPIGGRINTFLLEKSRIIEPARGERNFHIFYQLTKSADDKMRQRLHLKMPTEYNLLNRTGVFNLRTLGDEKERDLDIKNEKRLFMETMKSMRNLNFSDETIQDLFSVVSAILWLGQVEFLQEDEYATVSNRSVLEIASQLLQCDTEALEKSFVSHQVPTGKDIIFYRHNYEDSVRTRDGILKLLYDRVFKWVVKQVNIALEVPMYDSGGTRHIGILDIYGFEIFKINSFEQFCINYVNEKLQQIFIDNTLKKEQEEYEREGVRWEDINYFNNKVVCDLIEKKKNSVIALLDETCVVPRGNDALFLEKINNHFERHAQFLKAYVTESATMFKIIHYAGLVEYETPGFVEKNKDIVSIDHLLLGESCQNSVCMGMFEPGEAKERMESRKKPPTSASQFRTQVEDLAVRLNQCIPHYIRCIKSNEGRRPLKFDIKHCANQIRYLGLLESTRVRRAGYAFREDFEMFLDRNKIVSSETWPFWNGSAPVGILKILEELQVPDDKFQLGKTKIFLKEPETLFSIEKRREEMIAVIMSQVKASFRAKMQVEWFRDHRTAAKIQALVRGTAQSKSFYIYKSARMIQAWWKGVSQRQWLKHYRCAQSIQSIVNMGVMRQYIFEYRICRFLQAWWRGEKQRNWQKGNQLASLLQAVWKSKAMRDWRTSYRAAALIQGLIRGKQSRIWMKNEKAAFVIQSVVKGFLDRRWRKRTLAAYIIQAMVNGRLTRIWLVKHKAALVIQPIIKGKLTRDWLIKHKAMLKIHGAVKQKLWTQWFIDHNAALRIQSWWRARVTKEWYEDYRAAVELQKIGKTFCAKEWYRMEKLRAERREMSFFARIFCLGGSEADNGRGRGVNPRRAPNRMFPCSISCFQQSIAAPPRHSLSQRL